MKQEPPKPTLALRNLLPRRLSIPTALATSLMSASVFSHNAEMALMDEIRWARKALDTSFESSLLQMLVVRIRSRATHLSVYIDERVPGTDAGRGRIRSD